MQQPERCTRTVGHSGEHEHSLRRDNCIFPCNVAMSQPDQPSVEHKGALTKRQQTLQARHAGHFCPRCERFNMRVNNCAICPLCLKCCAEMQDEVTND